MFWRITESDAPFPSIQVIHFQGHLSLDESSAIPHIGYPRVAARWFTGVAGCCESGNCGRRRRHPWGECVERGEGRQPGVKVIPSIAIHGEKVTREVSGQRVVPLIIDASINNSKESKEIQNLLCLLRRRRRRFFPHLYLYLCSNVGSGCDCEEGQ